MSSGKYDGSGDSQSGTIENRRLRFATIDGIERADLPLAAEVWLEDLRNQSWVSREILKLSILFTRYIAKPNPESLLIGHVERTCQLDSEQAMEALRLMQMYGAVEAYARNDETLSVSLNLTLLHRLKVLDVRQRFAELRSASKTARKEEKRQPDWPVIYSAGGIGKAG
jgi:hypothetical protein